MDSSIGLLGALSTNLAGLLTAAYLGLIAWAWQAGSGPQSRWCLAAAVLIAVMAWIMALRRARAIVDLPLSRISSAAQGYVQVKGIARSDPGNPVLSTYGHTTCVWYRYHLYQKDHSERKWREVDSGVSSATFEVADGSGNCRIDPDHAEVAGAEVRTTYPGDDKLVEELLFAGREVFVLGEFATIGGANSALNQREDMDLLLKEWKANPSGLLRRFDLDGNGEIDLREWELARRLATETVERQHRELRNQPGLDIIRKPGDGRPFLISALPPARLRRRYVAWAFFHAAASAVAAWLLVRAV